MRMCHIRFAYYPGQGNTATYEYTQNLVKAGLDVHAIVAGRPGEREYEEVNGVKVYRIPFQFVKKGSLLNSVKFAVLANKKLGTVSKDHVFNIIHAYSSFGISIIGFQAKRKGIKSLYDIRSGAIRGGVFSLVSKAIQKIESLLFDTVIVLDKELGESIFGKMNRKNIFVMPLGANFELFYPKKNNEIREKYGIKDEVLLIHTGSLHPKRSLHEVIYGFKKVLEKKDNLKLMFVGNGPDIQKLKKVAKDLKLEERIIFTDYVDYYEMPDHLNAADIAISYIPITPEFDVQPPLKTVEYLACGLPTIATDTLGNRRFIEDGYNGLLVRDDPESLSEAIIRLLQHKDLRETLVRNSRASVVNYDFKVIVREKLLPLYEGILTRDEANI